MRRVIRVRGGCFVELAERNAVVVKDMLVEQGLDISERTVQRVVADAQREQRAFDVATARFRRRGGFACVSGD